MILSIESSCDDSSIAITNLETYELIFHQKISQEQEHSVYGGVVPELASRLHIKNLPDILINCKKYFKDLKAIAVTNQPGLSVSLMQGVIMAEALSITLGIPMYKINHLTGHIYSLFIEQKSVQAPISILLVSGGHTQIMQMIDLQNITTISKSLDDSFGESFDKTAKMLGLGYPGGPIVQSLAQNGDENRFNFPVPLIGSPTLDFSYSGLKNSVRLAILEQKEKTNDILDDDFISDICASFQKKAIEHIVNKTKRYFKKNIINNFAIVGGASANIALRLEIESICKQNNCKLHLAPLKFCSDNAAMIGRVGVDLHNCNTINNN